MLLPFFHNKFCEAGLDEAGRGCFAGPVCAAAVILPKDFNHPLLNDSKQLTKEERDMLRPVIEKESLCYSVAMVDNNEIDQINILQAERVGSEVREPSSERVIRLSSSIRGQGTFPTAFRLSPVPTNCTYSFRPNCMNPSRLSM